MTVETPIEILHLPEKMNGLFAAHLPKVPAASAEETERNFLSRALAAYAIHKLGQASVEEAAASVVDGGGDGGIDAVHFSPTSQKLWLAQSKFIASGRGEPDLGDVTKFKTGLENLLQGNFDAFAHNAIWAAMIPKLEIYFKNTALQVKPILVYSGIHLVSEDRRRLFEDLKRRFSADSDYLEFHVCNLTTVHDWMTGADHGPGVEKIDLKLLRPGWVTDPFETVYGLLALKDLAAMGAEHGKRLIAANIRGFKGNTDVNGEIIKTAKSEAKSFFYLNNGLTAYCERLEVHNLDRGNADSKRITAHGFSIVNGAQTVGSVAEVFAMPPDPVPDGFVFMKVISLEKCEDDRAFAERITRSTNFQNQIGLRDFAAQYEQQEVIAKQLSLSGISYHYKSEADLPTPDAHNFTLEEATTACACLVQANDCDFVARILANRHSLWSLEPVYPEQDGLRSRCERVFRPDRSARTVWRAVQAQRLLLRALQDSGRTSAGVRKAFFENARWLVLNVLFLRLRPEQADALNLTPEEEQQISIAATEISETLFGMCEAKGFVSRVSQGDGQPVTFESPRHFRSVFSAGGDCQILRSGLLAALAGAAEVSSGAGHGGMS